MGTSNERPSNPALFMRGNASSHEIDPRDTLIQFFFLNLLH